MLVRGWIQMFETHAYGVCIIVNNKNLSQFLKLFLPRSRRIEQPSKRIEKHQQLLCVTLFKSNDPC